MKKTILLFALALIGYTTYAQKHSCCQPAATEAFAMLGAKSEFQSAHLAPEPISFEPTTGKLITFKTSDGKDGNAFQVNSASLSNHYLYVFHEWWGLNDHIKKETEELAAALPGVNVIAVDLYDGKIATNAEEAGATMQAVRKERAESLILGAYEIAGKSASIQTIGWCFGGGWSLQAAMLAGTKNIGCVMYYGMPEKDENKLKALNAPVLGIFATQDGWINKPVVDAFETQMKQLNKAITIHWYDAEHAFANPSNPKFNKDAASDAMAKSIAFIKSNFLQR